MERWAANTLRILGIIVTSIVVICGCLLLFLLGQCAGSGGYGGRNPAAGGEYYFGALVLGVAGVWLIATLARGIGRSRQTSPAPVVPQETAAPAPPAPGTLGKIEFLNWAIVAQLVVSALWLAYTIVQYQRMPYFRHATIPVVLSSAFSVFPYVLLLVFLRRRITQAVLAFAVGVPAAAVLVLVFTTLPLLHLYFRTPLNVVMLMVPFVIDLIIIVLAYQSQHPAGLTLAASSLFTTTIAALVYFYSLHLIMQFVFRNFVR